MKNFEIYVLADNIRSLYNIGSLFRLCDGVGVSKLYLCGMSGAPHERVKYQRQRRQIAKTALEGLDNVEWEYHENAIELLQRLKLDGIQVVALEQTESSVSYLKAGYKDRVCLVFGHEVEGVSQEVLKQVDAAIDIPMHGQGKSLNVISAASIALYHVRASLEG